MDEVEYVTVKTVQGAIEEAQLCSFLEAHGIPVKVRGEALRFTHGIVVNGIGATEIEVPAAYADQARDLLARAERGELELVEDFETDQDTG